MPSLQTEEAVITAELPTAAHGMAEDGGRGRGHRGEDSGQGVGPPAHSCLSARGESLPRNTYGPGLATAGHVRAQVSLHSVPSPSSQPEGHTNFAAPQFCWRKLTYNPMFAMPHGSDGLAGHVSCRIQHSLRFQGWVVLGACAVDDSAVPWASHGDPSEHPVYLLLPPLGHLAPGPNMVNSAR